MYRAERGQGQRGDKCKGLSRSGRKGGRKEFGVLAQQNEDQCAGTQQARGGREEGCSEGKGQVIPEGLAGHGVLDFLLLSSVQVTPLCASF